MTENLADTQGAEILALVNRGGIVESRHFGHFVELDREGKIKFSRGNVKELIFPRSSIKAVQTSAMVRAGLKLEPRLLALVSASHSGSQTHRNAVLEILALGGLAESALQNAKDRPLGEEERRQWGGGLPTALAQNCSGKHAGMLLTCVINNWSTSEYLLPTHPLQLKVREEFEVLSEESISLTSVDGCGAPLFLISLLGLARAIQKLTISNQPAHLEVMNACRGYPEMVAGEGRSTSQIMRETPGLFLKEGAEGVGVGSLLDGRTFAFKVIDGAARAYTPLVYAALKHFGAMGRSNDEDFTPVYGGTAVVGSISTSF